MRLLTVLLALLFARDARGEILIPMGGGGSTPSACAKVGVTQTFVGGSTTGWSLYDASGSCPVAGDAGTETLQRSRPGATDCTSTSEGLARWDTPVGTSGCILQRATAHAPGFVFWHQAGPLGEHYQTVRCHDGPTCANLRISNDNGILQSGICSTFGAVSAGEYLGLCYERIAPNNNRVEVWHFTTSHPGAPPTWGEADCSTTFCVDDDDCGAGPPGDLAGVNFRATGVAQGAAMRADDPEFWAGCSEHGGDSGANSWEAGNSWSTGNSWL